MNRVDRGRKYAEIFKSVMTASFSHKEIGIAQIHSTQTFHSEGANKIKGEVVQSENMSSQVNEWLGW